MRCESLQNKGAGGIFLLKKEVSTNSNPRGNHFARSLQKLVSKTVKNVQELQEACRTPARSDKQVCKSLA